MNKAIFAVVVLCGLAALCSGMACPPNFCRSVVCPEVTQESCQHPMAMFVPGGSVCGCCDICVYLPKMEVSPPGDVPAKLCPLPFLGAGEQGYYSC